MQSVPYLLEIELNNEITSCKAEISHETKENFSDDNSDEKDSYKESITDGRYYHRRSKIAESVERERSTRPSPCHLV